MKTIWCNFLREKHFEKMRWAEAIIAPKKTSCFGPLENFFLQGTKTTTTHAYSLLCENKFHYSLYLGSATGWSIWIDHNSIIVINNAYFSLMIFLGAFISLWKIYILLFFKSRFWIFHIRHTVLLHYILWAKNLVYFSMFFFKVISLMRWCVW